MDSIELPFTPDKAISVNLPEGVIADIFEPHHVQPKGGSKELIIKSLQNPLGCKRIEDSVGKDDRVLIICDDITRPTPTEIILPILIDFLNIAGVPNKQIEILFSLGTHRPMNKDEIIKKVGEKVFNNIVCHNHDALNKNELEYYGKTSEGIPVWLNYRLKQSTFVIGVGDVVPHPIAGFSGGAKILYPGVAGEETIAGFHVSFGLDPRNHYGSLSAPSRTSIHELARIAGLDFVINTVLTDQSTIVDVFAGNYLAVYEAGIKIAQQVYGVPTRKLYDVVVASSYPAWLEFWQGGKGIYAAVTLAKPGAEIILISACPEGIAQTHSDFGVSIGEKPEEVLRRIQENIYHDPIGAAIAVKLGSLREKYRISLVSSGLSQDDANLMGLEWYSNVDVALQTALKRKNYPNEIGIIPFGGHTYCYLDPK